MRLRAYKKAYLYIFGLLFSLLIVVPCLVFAGVKNTKHNLSVSGTGDAKALTETEVCLFCHTPHNASPSYPLWNHELSSVDNYTNYWSPTLQSYPSAAEAPPAAAQAPAASQSFLPAQYPFRPSPQSLDFARAHEFSPA